MNKKAGYGRLVLVRHGESVWNMKGLWTGWTDVSLTKKGQEEALKAASVLKGINFNLYLSSDLKRASHTLEIILKELEGRVVNYLKVASYKERHYGIYTGKNKWEIQEQVGKAQFKLLRRGWDVPISGGETLKDVYDRVMPHFKNEVLKRLVMGQNILIVAHGNTHRAIVKYLENISDEKIADIEMATGEVIIYEIDHTGNVKSKIKKAFYSHKGKK